MNKQHLKLFSLISIIRQFFAKENFIDVLTPPAVQNPGMETHIHPFKVSSMLEQEKESSLFLHTSPEFCMKELLSEGLSKIFTISYCFRDEPTSIQHRAQFLML
ncbi:MAG: EF-P lysine aminoacylase GenX, partial [Bdellovibrionales bacterium]|nr:EF-P lysine aminoacylase GenX [Bdellovibrionales bacterium]